MVAKRSATTAGMATESWRGETVGSLNNRTHALCECELYFRDGNAQKFRIEGVPFHYRRRKAFARPTGVVDVAGCVPSCWRRQGVF